MIDLVVFKKQIENNTLVLDKNSLFIFIGKDKSSEFIFDQYLKIFSSNNNLSINYIHSLECNNLFDDHSQIKVFKTDKLDKISHSFSGWVYCKTVSKDIRTTIESIIELPKLEKWQIIDYISSKSNIELNQAEKLYLAYSDIYKLDIESEKLCIFNKNVFDLLNDQLEQTSYELFDLTNAILQRDLIQLKLLYKSNIKVDTFILLSVLIKNFKQVIDIQLSKNASAESLGISGKQFWAIKKYNCNKYSRDELLYIYELLTSLDLKIKTGQIDTNIIQDYIVFKIISL